MPTYKSHARMFECMRPNATDQVTLNDAPRVPNLRFRRFRGASDYPSMVEVMKAARDADGLEFTISVENLEREFKHLENCDPFQDFLFAEVDGAVVGYTEVWWKKDLSGNYLFNQHVNLHPEWRVKGLRSAMLRYNERRLRDIAKAQPQDGPRLFQSVAIDSEEDWISVLEGGGYRVFRHGLMLVRPNLEDIPDLSLPAGIEVRPVKPEHYRLVVGAWNEACKDMRGQVPISDETFKSWQDSPVFNPSIWQVAWHGDEVVGTVMNFIDEEDNKAYNRKRVHPEMISVKRGWRRKGIATALLARSLKVLKENGMTEAALGVDAENPSGARRIYEKMGFKVAKKASFYRKPMD